MDLWLTNSTFEGKSDAENSIANKAESLQREVMNLVKEEKRSW